LTEGIREQGADKNVFKHIKGRKKQEAGENYIMKSFIICNLHQNHHVIRMGEIKNLYETLVGKPETICKISTQT
jgi:hypothetical protein